MRKRMMRKGDEGREGRGGRWKGGSEQVRRISRTEGGRKEGSI